MKQVRPFIFSFIFSAIYMLLATTSLYYEVFMNNNPFPKWLETVLLPGYIFGLACEFIGGIPLAAVGQLFSFAAVFASFCILEAGISRTSVYFRNAERTDNSDHQSQS